MSLPTLFSLLQYYSVMSMIYYLIIIQKQKKKQTSTYLRTLIHEQETLSISVLENVSRCWCTFPILKPIDFKLGLWLVLCILRKDFSILYLCGLPTFVSCKTQHLEKQIIFQCAYENKQASIKAMSVWMQTTRILR